jgi:hypothetical protein
VEAAFDDHALSGLFAARNVLVHRAGVVDRTFVDRMKSNTVVAQQQPGEALLLTGPIVIKTVEGTFDQGVALLLATDNWLSANPE